LGWYAWKRGYSLVFNPRAVVDHIIHPDTLSRDRREARKEVLRVAENNLLFYRLYGIERDVSGMCRVTWFINNLARNLIRMCKGHELRRLAWIEGTLFSELIGLKWLVSRKVGGDYYPLIDFRRLLDTN